MRARPLYSFLLRVGLMVAVLAIMGQLSRFMVRVAAFEPSLVTSGDSALNVPQSAEDEPVVDPSDRNVLSRLITPTSARDYDELGMLPSDVEMEYDPIGATSQPYPDPSNLSSTDALFPSIDPTGFAGLSLVSCPACEPWRVNARIEYTRKHVSDGVTSTGSCSGALIDPMHVLTAGHCAYLNQEGVDPTPLAIRAAPGYGGGIAPYGEVLSTNQLVWSQWMTSWDKSYDIAVLQLDRPVGALTGWWQIDYNGVTGWVYGEIVTASNTEDVPEVVPPTLTPMPATATPPPPTATTESVDPTIETASPTTTATVTPDVQTATPGPAPGDVVANAFSVEGAPGPFDVDADIWFNGDVTCAAGQDVNYTHLGAWVEQTAQFQVSWSNETLTSGQRFTWRDRIAIASPGTYNLWLRVCFGETNCTNLSGPVVVEVQ